MNDARPKLRALRCEKCGTEFTCGANTDSCWCADESFRMPLPVDGSDCWCPECLRKAAANAAAADR